MKKKLFIALMLFLSYFSINAQNKQISFKDVDFSGLKFRSIGPAFMSGRIADIAINPENENVWYIAVGSGGVWKTENSGTTWTPLFDKQDVYSIGCVNIDPNNPNRIWVGTGENVGGRHVGFGDGIYLSTDAGKTWKNMGLKNSERISKIIVHPQNPDIVWVAAQGGLWSSGGERGIYMTTDGGKTWNNTLSVNKWTGATDLLIDPRNPRRLYAATWQRHRNVAAYMGGGPGSGIYRSDDGGISWKKLSQGLPKSNMGKIGLAISPQQPDVIYAAIELDRRKGAVYRSTDRGASWTKMSDAVSGGTGPHYYQELYASPHHFDLIFLADVRMQMSKDGGKTFKQMNEKFKHSDNHAMAFKKSDPNFMLVGTDGGLYVSYDHTKTWKYIDNLPVTQFYKLAVDDTEPFYKIYGGTQDNNTQCGPSRTDNLHGIRNADWEVVLFADGHQPATEPGNPDIVYAEWQQGNLVRIDRKTGEVVHIQPQPGQGEPFERFNWDAPILVSPHNPTTLYYASYRVWKSTDRGNNWTAISGDLTKNQERMALPIMGKKQSYDNAWDLYAMSVFNTITSLAESPKQEGLIYVGTDDGLIQITEDSGKSWQKIEVSKLPGVPASAFVNNIVADLFDANTVYIALDNHKYGDFKPYLYKSTNKGKTWTSLTNNLPQKTIVWRLVQDHVQPNLLFIGTEFGIYFSINGGKEWKQLKGGMPTIAVRDLTIQRRENDLVAATFGRGFYILDDISPLRKITGDELNKKAVLFDVKDAWWYIPRSVIGFEKNAFSGANHFIAPNPPYGAVFTYYLKDELKSKEQIRKEKEKQLEKENKDIPFPGWKKLSDEKTELKPVIWLTVTDENDNVIRRIKAETGKGFHRVAWDLRYPAQTPIRIDNKTQNNGRQAKGQLVMPGNYKVQLALVQNGVITVLSEFKTFAVKEMRKPALEGPSHEETAAFWKDVAETQQKISALNIVLQKSLNKCKAMKTALDRAAIEPGSLDTKLESLRQNLVKIDIKLNGNPAKNEPGERNTPGLNNRMGTIFTSMRASAYGPTGTQKKVLALAKKEYLEYKTKLKTILDKDMKEMENALQKIGAPWIDDEELP
ncbi:MAG: hypothetical protein L3J74_14215 [Bacteroidales bacterium]|nr:hypothetical protein [Bacteroidales bacterium]